MSVQARTWQSAGVAYTVAYNLRPDNNNFRTQSF
jgi:hypothetical protein